MARNKIKKTDSVEELSAPLKKQSSRNWIGVIMGKALNYRRPDTWTKKITDICGDGVRYEVVNSEVLNDNGDWYLFINDVDWKEHISALKQCNFVVGLVCDGNSPYLFSDEEISAWIGGIEKSRESKCEFEIGDIVLVKKGFLSNLYGVIEKINGKRAKVFFSFYIRSFYEMIALEDLEFVHKSNFRPSQGGCHITMGVRSVFTNNICR